MNGSRPILVGMIAIVLVLFLNTLTSWSQTVKDSPASIVYSITITPSIKEEPSWHPEPMTQQEVIDWNVEDICQQYGVDPALIKSIIWHESRGNPLAGNGSCLGLMQISTKWHAARASRLGVTDFYDIRGNILLGVDYISELLQRYSDPAEALMFYNMGSVGVDLYNSGHISNYAQSVLDKANEIR